MKTSMTLIGAVLIALPITASAEPDREGPPRGKQLRERMIEKFDADGDGKLNEDERKAAREAIQQRRKRMIAKHDTDGDGKLSREERKAAMQQFHEKVLNEFDADGDGKLSPEERKTARKTLRERGERPPFPPRRRFRDRRGGGPEGGPRRGRRGQGGPGRGGRGPGGPGGEGLPDFEE